ncbi:hypothetical protein BX616_010607 [Lobosporangium transversale]|nr:hypothetical protein BX616_010607 [Lobosporangium transversale]
MSQICVIHTLKRVRKTSGKRNDLAVLTGGESFAEEMQSPVNCEKFEKKIIDETGFNLYLIRKYGSRKGRPANVMRPTVRDRNVSVVGAILSTGIICMSATTVDPDADEELMTEEDQDKVPNNNGHNRSRSTARSPQISEDGVAGCSTSGSKVKNSSK